jgi:hypothetical protein
MGLPLGQLSKMALASADLSEKMKKIQFPSATEDQKMMIANMAEMKGGEYVVNFTDSKGNAVQDKKVTELSPDDIKALGEASKPKSMEELAKGQLTTLEKINASINTLGGRLPYAIAGSKIGKEAQEAPRDLYAAIEKTFSGESLKIKNLRKGIDENSDLVLGSLKKIATGEGSWEDISHTVKEISGNMIKFSKNVALELKNKSSEAGSELTNSNNRIVKGASTAVKTAADKVQQVVKVEDFVIKTLPQDTLVMAGGTKLNDNQSQTNTNSTIDVNFTLKIESNQTIDEKQLAVMFENTGVKQKMIEVIKTGGFNGGLTGGNSSKQKQMIT